MVELRINLDCKLFRGGREPPVAVSPGFELLIHVGAFGVGGEECGAFLGGHVKVLTDLARLAKLQFQNAFLGNVADVAILLDSTVILCILESSAFRARSLLGCE